MKAHKTIAFPSQRRDTFISQRRRPSSARPFDVFVALNRGALAFALAFASSVSAFAAFPHFTFFLFDTVCFPHYLDTRSESFLNE